LVSRQTLREGAVNFARLPLRIFAPITDKNPDCHVQSPNELSINSINFTQKSDPLVGFRIHLIGAQPLVVYPTALGLKERLLAKNTLIFPPKSEPPSNGAALAAPPAPLEPPLEPVSPVGAASGVLFKSP
jgi:hypothetical protein